MVIDLFRPHVWIVFALGLLILTPLTAPVARKWACAALNLLLLAALLKKRVVLVLVGVVLVWFALLLLQKGRKPALVSLVTGTLILALWLLHKLPKLSSAVGTSRLNPLLVTVGFSYCALRMVDVMRAVFERRQPAPDLAQTINYLLPFNMLSAGPIQAYDDFVAQPAVPPPLTLNSALVGAERIVTGLFKKYVIAISLERLFLTGFRSHGLYLLLEAQIYFLWLYLDFSAYSDIAVGMGRLMGIATPENFNRPYLARNVIDFWERWHISLSQFIRRNVFLPLQLHLIRGTQGRNPLGVASLVFAISFLLCGFWHNVSPRWLLWGGLQAAGLITCNLYRHAFIKRYGRKELNRSLANPWLRALSIAATYEFAALTMAATMVSF